jgi:hypothetical protein
MSSGTTTTTSLSFTPDSALADGSHTLYVQERDAAGQWSVAGSLALVVDTVPPNAPAVTSGSATATIRRPEWTWVSGGNAGNGTYRYKLDDSDLTAGATTTTSLSYTPASDLQYGNHTLYVQERDAAGNWSSSGSYTVFVDVYTVDAVSLTPESGWNPDTVIVQNGGTLTITNPVSISNITVESNSTVVIDRELSLTNLTVNSGIVTSTAYANTFSGSTWSTAPAPGNGQLILNLSGTLTVGASGRIHMDAKGYHGGTSSRSQGGSTTGPGITSTSPNGGGGAGNNGVQLYASGGSYGTSGAWSPYGLAPGSVYGESDFTTQLYLGSGGGSGYNHSGGYGGGAIKISAANVSLASGAQITAKGGAGASTTYAGGGSGGTIVLGISGTYTNSGGTISVAGGGGTYFGGDGRISFPQSVLIDGSNNLTVAGIYPINIHLTSSINTFTVGANTTVNLTAANNVTVNSLVINGASAEVDVNSEWTQATYGRSFGSVTVTNGILSSKEFDNAFSGSSWTSTPGAGNGKLIMDITGILTVAASGRIHMDAKGYHGGRSGRTQGGSPTGPGASSTAANGGGGGGTTTQTGAGAGSYGTAGVAGSGAVAGTTYGASDFATQLYLGSGGGSGYNGNGAFGGGAIKITAASASLATGAQITAKGGAGSTYPGSGSGGTVVLSVSGAFSNSGTISVAGGAGTRAGGDGRSQFP